MNRLAWLVLVLSAGVVNADEVAVRDAGGNVLGAYGGPAGAVARQLDGSARVVQPGVRVISATGYAFVVQMSSGQVGTYAHPTLVAETVSGFAFGEQLLFETTDCSGQAFLDVDVPAGALPTGVLGGFVVALPPTGDLYYANKTDGVATRFTRSFRDLTTGQCQAVAPFDDLRIPVQPNIPGITGVPASSFLGPITLSRAEVVRFFFRDGFESLTS